MDKILDNYYVGDMSDMNPMKETDPPAEDFERVVTLGPADTPYTTEQYDVKNRKDASEPFFKAADSVRTYVDDPELTFVHCTAGVSRGASVTATALAAERDIPLEEAFDLVTERRPDTTPHPDLKYLGQEYLYYQVDGYSHKELYEGDVEQNRSLVEESTNESVEETENTTEERTNVDDAVDTSTDTDKEDNNSNGTSETVVDEDDGSEDEDSKEVSEETTTTQISEHVAEPEKENERTRDEKNEENDEGPSVSDSPGDVSFFQRLLRKIGL